MLSHTECGGAMECVSDRGVIWWFTLTGVIFFVADEGGRPGPRFFTTSPAPDPAPDPPPDPTPDRDPDPGGLEGPLAREARAAAAAALLARLLVGGGDGGGGR